MTDNVVQERLLDVIRRRADRWVRLPTLDDPNDRADWWHVAWERLGDVAYLQSIEPSAVRAAWLRSEVRRLCGLDPDLWIGPEFRSRTLPSIGSLETAHLGLAVATVLRLCPTLIDRAEVAEALTLRCLEPCERALELRESGGVAMNNWYHVLLDGYSACALIIGDERRVASLAERVDRAVALTEGDSYGESVQYWSYAAVHLSHVAELAADHGLVWPAELHGRLVESLSRCLPWVAQSIMFADVASRWGGGGYLSMINFGDSAVTARPPADVLLFLAREATGREAGLARWLYDLGYAEAELAPTDLSTFGFFHQPTWRSLRNLPGCAEPLDPAAAGLDAAQRFAVGTVILRGPEREKTVLAIQGGHDALRVNSHRHGDAGSFVLGHGGEVIFSDPGHCCYRLPAYRAAVAETAHSTWTVTGADGVVLPQRTDGRRTGSLTGPAPWDTDLVNPGWLVGTDVAAAYGPPLRTARRTWLFRPPHLLLIMDEVVADEPVRLASRFVINNRDGLLSINRATDRRTVLRRNGAAAKFFLLDARTDDCPADWPLEQHHSTLHDVYDPHPDAPGQGQEGSGADLVFEAPAGRRHRAVYSVVLDIEPRIRSWHVAWVGDGIVLGHPDGLKELIKLPPASARG
ncbi:heparinase II/III family protein [Microlunatus sp. GCM10028923]|uniref:heparinase II/III domain-containing protein n=1 Tax=Microlunatus sp. GCM10028923 TaxID=3273400 RepID=UPI00361D2C9C